MPKELEKPWAGSWHARLTGSFVLGKYKGRRRCRDHPRPRFSECAVKSLASPLGPEKGHTTAVGRAQRSAMPTAAGTEAVLMYELNDHTLHLQPFS